MRLVALFTVAFLLAAGCAANDPSASTTTGPAASDPCDDVSRDALTLSNASHPVVLLSTKEGCIVAEMYASNAPLTVENFLAYVDSGFFDNTLIHRISKEFVLQGGGVDAATGQAKAGLRAPVKHEGKESGLHNEAYTFAMARTADPNSATSQFFINVKDNRACLDPVTGTCDPRGNGYTVFAKVVQGTDVVDRIHALPVTTSDRHPYCLGLEDGAGGSCPVDPVPVTRARRL